MRHGVTTGVLVCALALAVGVASPAFAQASKAPAKAGDKVVNLNTATAAQLEDLPGIGPSTAKRIIEYREKNGSFKKIEELMNVKGIGEKSFLKLKELIVVTPPPPARAGQ